MVLKEQGTDSVACGLIAGSIGNMIENQLKLLNINSSFVTVKGNSRINVKIMADCETAINGKVGDDFFGKQLREAITEVGIDSTGLLSDPEIHTTLAMVHTYPDGDSDFSFYRNPGADMMLKEDEIPTELIKNSKIFHFGTLSMPHDGVRAATKKAISIAEEANALISFDPNLRPPLWKSLDDAKEQVLYGLGHCHILKISDYEIQWLT